MTENLFNLDLIQKYDVAGPRYTSYPTAAQFVPFDESAYRAQAAALAADSRYLSLYFHIPFCDTVCFYCACNKVVTKHRERAEPYLQRLHREIQLQAEIFSNGRVVKQIHWGGGTPTFISHGEMRRLMAETRRHFDLAGDADGEYSIEIDPREIAADTLELLREIGFNRVSFGVQDVDEKVQKAVNRIQPRSQTEAAMQAARDHGFQSINIDLIYGLPFQTVRSYTETIDAIIEMSPDRLSVFNYAHLPERFKPQRRIQAEDLPAPAEKLDILSMVIDRLQEAGYVYIGMDHFAKPDDQLAVAQTEGGLYRNFQGYSTHSDCELIAMGITSIGQVGRCYAQNVKELESYYAHLDAGRLAVERGVVLNDDDVIRRALITELICHFRLDTALFAARHQIRFQEYFAREWPQLQAMAADGLLDCGDGYIEVLAPGRLLIRNICMVFDNYLRQNPGQRFSKVI